MMRRMPWVQLLVSAFIGAGHADAQEVGPPSPEKLVTRPIQVLLDAESKKDPYCVNVATMMETHLASLNRFEPTKHVVRVACTQDSVEATWYVKTRVKKRLSELVGARTSLNRTIVRSANPGSIGLLVMQDLLKRLPWDGELRRVHPASEGWETIRSNPGAKEPVNLTKLKSAPNRKRLSLSLGAVNSENVGICLPIEIGIITNDAGNAKFKLIGQGIISDIDIFASYAEAWSSGGWGKHPPSALYFRLRDPGKDDRLVTNVKKQCEKKTGFVGGKTLDTILSGDFGALFSTETIELNAINQGIGLSYFTLRANNGQKVPSGVAGWLYNTVLIGDLFMVNFNFVRHIIAPAYTPALEGQQVKAQVNMGELFTNLIFDTDEWAVFFGMGAFVAKINLPFENDALEETSTVTQETPEGTLEATQTTFPVRPLLINPALNLGGQYVDDPFRYEVRFATSFSKKNGAHLSFYGNADYMLTATWYTGLNLYIVNFSDSESGAPGANYFSLGGRIGFDLQRNRGSKKK